MKPINEKLIKENIKTNKKQKTSYTHTNMANSEEFMESVLRDKKKLEWEGLTKKMQALSWE